MGFGKWLFKMFVSIAFDLLDMIMPPGLGTIYDIAGGFLGLMLWGGKGAAQFWEIIDVTDRIDAFVPTLTIMGIFSMREIRY